MKNPFLLYILLLVGLGLGVNVYYLTYQKTYLNTGHYDEGWKVGSHRGLPKYGEIVQNMKDLGTHGFSGATGYYEELQAKYDSAIITRNLFLVSSVVCLVISLAGLYRLRKGKGGIGSPE